MKDPFEKFAEESLALNLGPQLRLPRPGESGFSKSDSMLSLTTVPPTLDPFLNYDYHLDYPSVTSTASPVDKKKTTPKKPNTDSLMQKLNFVDPVQGDPFSVTFNPLPTNVYPAHNGNFLNFEKTKLYPETYDNKQNVGSFNDPHSNSLHNDLQFFTKLKNDRKRTLAERLLQNIEKPYHFGSKNNFMDPLWLYLLTSS
jgi:hypothetical protein